MEIDSLYKYINLNKMANGTVEVLFAGQPCITVSEGLLGSVWKINPVFAKLVYGANIFEDIPVCTEGFGSTEAAISAGLVKLHELGAFNTEIDFPEDTYAATMDVVAEDVKAYALKNSGSLMEAHTKFGAIMKSIDNNTFVSEFKEREVVPVVAESVPVETLVETPSVTEAAPTKHADIFSKWNVNKNVNESFNSDDYYLVDKESKKVIRNIGQKRISPEHFATPSKSPLLSGHIKQASHTIMSGLQLNRHGYTNESRSEYAANMGLSGALDTAKNGTTVKKKVWLKSPTGARLSDHDNEADALRTWKNLDSNKGVKIMKEDDESELDITDQVIAEGKDIDAAYEKWESDVKKTHPTKSLKFKGRIEKGVNTVSAEETGKDRSYGVWDHETNKGHVFNESTEEGKE